jgi:hypothetical protein
MAYPLEVFKKFFNELKLASAKKSVFMRFRALGGTKPTRCAHGAEKDEPEGG